MLMTILLTRAVAEVEKLIEERGVEAVMRIEEINAARRRRRLENESEEEKRAREIEEENDRWRRTWGKAIFGDIY